MPIHYFSRNMIPLFVGAFGGLLAGSVLLALSHAAPRFGAGGFVRDLDEVCILGHDCSRREAHVMGIALHLGLSVLFGALFVWGVNAGVFSGFQFIPLALYALFLVVCMGGVVLPLEGHGFFGMEEDVWFSVDLVLTNMLWVLLYGVFMRFLT